MGKSDKLTSKRKANSSLKKSFKSDALKDKIEGKIKASKKMEQESEMVDDDDDEEPNIEAFLNSQANIDEDDNQDEKSSKKSTEKKLKNKAKKLESEEADMLKSMEKLAEKDPEFYNYLKENDKPLLDFDVMESDSDAVEANEDEEEEDLPTEKPSKKPIRDNEEGELTIKVVNGWRKALKEHHSMKTIKKILVAFRGAINASESTDDVSPYALTNPEVFSALLTLTLKQVPESIQHNIPLESSTSGSKYIKTDSKKFRNISNTLKAHATSLSTLLADVHDKDIANLVLKSVHTLLPYFQTFRKQLKSLIEATVSLWGSAEDDDTKMIAFAFIKTAAEENVKSLLEIILKATYAGILRSSRRTNIHTMPSLNFQKNSAATLYEIDESTSYQIGFQYIRQLAVHLRTSMVTKSPDSYKAIYNWQYANSLDFWSRALAATSESSMLRELIYPLIQVTLGAIRLVPTPQYFPLRFYLIRGLLRLSQATGVYIPIIPLLTEILTSTVITKSNKATTLKALDFEHNIRATKSYIGTRIYQDGVCEELIDLIGEFFVLHSKSPEFPEICIPVVMVLRRFSKKSKNVKFNKQIQRLVERIEANSKYITDKRRGVDFGPAQQDKVSEFLQEEKWEDTPLGSYVVVQRQVRAERARILRESIEAEETDKKQGIMGSDGEIGVSDLEEKEEEEEDNESDVEMSDS